MINDENKNLHLKKNRLSDGMPIYHNVFSCENVYDPDNPFGGLYTHDYIEVSMVVAGNGIHRVLNSDIPCRSGDIYITPPDIPHGYFLSDTRESLTVRQLRFDVGDWFDGDIVSVSSPRFCYGIFSESSVTAYAMLNMQTREEIDTIFNAVEREMSEKRNEWRDAVRAYLTQLLIIVGRYINCTIKNISSVSSKEWNMVLSAIKLIKEHFDDCGLTLEYIADTLFISKSHLSRIFKNLTGELFSEYLRDVRLENACRLLRNTNMTVEEIVKSCGLRDVASFYRAFGERMNMTPHAYRQTVNLSDENMSEENKEKTKGERIMSILNEISTNLQQGKAKIVKELVAQAIDAGSNPEQILNEGLLAGMSIIGEKFKNNEVYVPEVLVAARAMNMGMQVLKPYLLQNGVKATGKVCIGTVQGDLHDIGKNLVRMMMEGKGLEVVDLGTDVAPETFIQAAIEQNCQVICCSALLTTTMGVMEDVVKAAEAAGIRDKVKIMIGGAPVTDEYCNKIGADCYTSDAASAADAAVALCKA